MSEQTQTAEATATSNTDNTTTTTTTRVRRVGIFKRIANFFNRTLDVVEEVIVDTVPETGKTLYHSIAMVNKTAGNAHLTMAIENLKDIRDLKAECGLSEEDFESLKKSCKL